MKYLLIMQTQSEQRQVVIETPESELRFFIKGIIKLTKLLFMI